MDRPFSSFIDYIDRDFHLSKTELIAFYLSGRDCFAYYHISRTKLTDPKYVKTKMTIHLGKKRNSVL